MKYVIVDKNFRPHGNYSPKVYSEKGAKIVLTKLKKKGSVDLEIISLEEYQNRPAKMVERVNLMTGQKYFEDESTPGYLSPSSESYWSM